MTKGAAFLDLDSFTLRISSSTHAMALSTTSASMLGWAAAAAVWPRERAAAAVGVTTLPSPELRPDRSPEDDPKDPMKPDVRLTVLMTFSKAPLVDLAGSEARLDSDRPDRPDRNDRRERPPRDAPDGEAASPSAIEAAITLPLVLLARSLLRP